MPAGRTGEVKRTAGPHRATDWISGRVAHSRMSSLALGLSLPPTHCGMVKVVGAEVRAASTLSGVIGVMLGSGVIITSFSASLP